MHSRPNRLPRGFSSLIAAVVYHPHWSESENDSVRDHLFRFLSLAESKFPNCALIVAGDLNRLDDEIIKKHFRLKQIVKVPTRKDATRLLLIFFNFLLNTISCYSSSLVDFIVHIYL